MHGGYYLARRGSPLLLFDLLEGLIDVGLFSFCSQNGGIEMGGLLDDVLGADQVHNNA